MASDSPQRKSETSSEKSGISAWAYPLFGVAAALGTAVVGYFTKSYFWASKPSQLPTKPDGDLDLSLDALRRNALDQLKPPTRGFMVDGTLSSPEFHLVSSITRSQSNTQHQMDVIDRRGTDARFLELHDLLMQHSATYRQMVQTLIQRRNGAMIRILPQSDFEFDACWRTDINAVMITNPERLTDAQIGGLIVMEMTNALQDEDFARVNAQANEGHYESEHPADPAYHYALDNEAIEQRGVQMHRRIIDELVLGTGRRVGADWHRYQELSGRRAQDFSEYIRRGDAEGHIDYYRRYYNKDLRPEILRKRESQVSSRIRQHGARPVLPPLHQKSKKDPHS